MFALNICLALNLIILFVAFFFRKHNSLPNRILALILLDTALSFLGNASITGGFFKQFPYFFFLSWCTSSFFGPLVYAYTCLFTGASFKLIHPLWLTAFLLSAFGLSLPLGYWMLPAAERVEYAISLLREPLPWQMTVINIVGMLLIWVSLFAAVFKILRYQKRVLKSLSNLEKSRFVFISLFVILVGILTLVTTILYVVLPQHLVEYLFLPCLITLIYFFILFYSVRYHAIFTVESYDQFLHDTLAASEEMAIHERLTNSIAGNDLQELAGRIELYLKETEAYTNPDITIIMLADGLNSPVERFSEAINKVLKKSFFDLINEKRVEKAKLLLSKKLNEMTIEGIAYEAGFNSRASFYRAFKKYTSLTPSEYVGRLTQTPGASQ
jgi:AraC-like DNA-binding protein